MNAVRWYIYNRIKDLYPKVKLYTTYGAATKRSRLDIGLEKSHVNDAYSMGIFHPVNRARKEHFAKRRRNNRCLEKFYDAKYIDARDGKVKSGSRLGCERTNRGEPRISDKNLRIFRGAKKSKGHRSIRRQRYGIRPGDIILCNNKKIPATGVHCNGTRVLVGGKSYKLDQIEVVRHIGGWEKLIKS